MAPGIWAHFNPFATIQERGAVPSSMRKRSEGRPQGREISPGRVELSLATAYASYASTPAAVGGTWACSLASGSPARTREEDEDARRRPSREDPARAMVFADAIAVAAEHLKP
jgi:hypothetical protein